MRTFVAAAMLLSAAGHASGQVVVLITDRTTDGVWLLRDTDGDWAIDETTELVRWFGAGNASGLPATLNPNTIGTLRGASDTYTLVGDQDTSARRIYWTRDLNNDNDAMDAGEAGIFADISGAAGQWFAFPTGCTFDAMGRPVIVNAGNGFGPDAIWRCVDANADGDASDPGETGPLATVNGFSTSNGSFSPQEVVYAADGAVILRNSSLNLHGIWRIADLDGNGVADQAGEFTLWFGAGNLSSYTPSAGFAIDRDPIRPGAFYYQNVATGGVDEIWRVGDGNSDGDAQDSEEAVLVYTSGESGFTIIDIAPLADGSMLITDNGGKRVFRLTDTDGDGKFISAGERTAFFTNTTLQVGDVRNISVWRDVAACNDIDFNNNGVFPEDQDVGDFFDVLAGAVCAGCDGIDFNNNGVFPEDQDVIDFFEVLAGGECP